MVKCGILRDCLSSRCTGGLECQLVRGLDQVPCCALMVVWGLLPPAPHQWRADDAAKTGTHDRDIPQQRPGWKQVLTGLRRSEAKHQPQQRIVGNAMVGTASDGMMCIICEEIRLGDHARNTAKKEQAARLEIRTSQRKSIRIQGAEVHYR